MSQPPPLPAEFSCAGCGQKAGLPGRAAGKLIVCPGCGLRFRVPESTRVTRASPTKRFVAGIRGSPSTRVSASSSSLSLTRQDRHAPFPVLVVAVAGGALLTITAIGSAVILRQSQVSPAPVPSTARPHDSGVDTVPIPTSSPRSSPPAAAGRSVRVVELEGRPEAELREVLRPLASELPAMNAAAADDHTAERRAALVRLRMYRLLCGLAEDDLVVDDRMNEEAGAAAKVCHRLGYLSHEPPNPGLPNAEFEQARRGAGSGNLAFGMRDLVAAVDGWMDDSDPDNVAALGHRRWCLNPPLRRVGFGRSDRYFAMWAHDSSGSGQLRQPAICFPPPGCVPIDMFRPHYAWSVTLDPRHFKKPRPEEVTVVVHKLQKEVVLEPPLNLELMVVETGGYGIDNCIIFRPEGVSIAVGGRYRTEIAGLTDHDGKEVIVVYETSFVE